VKFRISTVVAFGIGYLVGSRSGWERAGRLLRPGGRDHPAPVADTVWVLSDKSRAVAALGVERMKDTIGVRLGWRDGEEAADAIALDLAEDLALALSSHRR
jgi:hypothetical protein